MLELARDRIFCGYVCQTNHSITWCTCLSKPTNMSLSYWKRTFLLRLFRFSPPFISDHFHYNVHVPPLTSVYTLFMWNHTFSKRVYSCSLKCNGNSLLSNLRLLFLHSRHLKSCFTMLVQKQLKIVTFAWYLHKTTCTNHFHTIGGKTFFRDKFCFWKNRQ